jgi:hypothetical protein
MHIEIPLNCRLAHVELVGDRLLGHAEPSQRFGELGAGVPVEVAPAELQLEGEPVGLFKLAALT